MIGLPLTALWKSLQLIAVSTAAMAAAVAALRWVLVFRLKGAAARDFWDLRCDGRGFLFLFMYYRRSAVFRDVLTLAGPRWSVLRRLADLWPAADAGIRIGLDSESRAPDCPAATERRWNGTCDHQPGLRPSRLPPHRHDHGHGYNQQRARFQPW